MGNESLISQAEAHSTSNSSALSDRRTSLRSRSSLESAATKEENAKPKPANSNQTGTIAHRSTNGLTTLENKRKGSGAIDKPKKVLRDTTNTKRASSTIKGVTRSQKPRNISLKKKEQDSLLASDETPAEAVDEDESPEPRKAVQKRLRKSLPTVEEEQEDVEAPAKQAPRATTKPRPPKSQTTGPAKRATAKKSSMPKRTKSTPDQSIRSRTSDISEASSLPHRPSAKDTVPITVHRLSQPQALNNITGNEDNTVVAPTLIKRSGVNAVDVLSQICKELITQSAESLQQRGGSEASGYEMGRGEAMRKRKAVEAFGAQLEERLFEMVGLVQHTRALSFTYIWFADVLLLVDRGA